MKTLLEFLEENRSTLKDGVYEVTKFGNIRRDTYVFDADGLMLTTDKYEVKNGNITLITPSASAEQWNKYNRQCKGVTIDVYDVLKAFEVTDPALQHLIKKALCAGLRGHKNKEQDLIDILDSAKRALELYHDDNGSTERPPEVSGVRGCDDNLEVIKKNINDIIDRNRDYKLS